MDIKYPYYVHKIFHIRYTDIIEVGSMVVRKTMIVFAILALISLNAVFAVGNEVQSPLSPESEKVSFISQLGINADSTSIPDNSVLLAVGSAEYPVTPGDRYSLSYYDGKNLVTLNFQADLDCKVSIPSFGVIEASGMTLMEFKRHVEDMVSTYYSYASPQLTLVGCGMFSVRVSGAVKYSQYVTAWGLSRLSDLAIYADDFASTREVQVLYGDGTSKTYDLYNGLRNGIPEDDPLLKPGCEVRFVQSSAIVSLGGAVKRPGVYQPKQGETLYNLINDYCGGLLFSADAESITVTNYSNGTFSARCMNQDDSMEYLPSDGDTVTVAYSSQSLPYVTITGAITQSSTDSTISSANKVMYRFVQGETALQLVRNISNMLTSTSDLSGVYILRGEEKIMVNASEALTTNGKGDVTLQQGDTVVIPFSQLTVTVTGSVLSPGTFAYVPDRGAEYYINLAKGFSADATQGYKILDRNGKKVSGNVVPADSTIVATKNIMTANIALVASVLSIVSTVLTIVINGHTIAGFF